MTTISRPAISRATDTGFKFGYGQALTKAFSIGTAVNYLTRAVGPYSSTLMSLDLAGTYWFSEKTAFAVKAGNIFSFADNTDDTMPLILRLGYSHKMFNDKLTMALDYEMPDQWYAGFEISLAPLFLRIGLNYEEMSTGIGYSFKDYRIDYALAQNTELGISNRISFSVKFGSDLSEAEE